MVAGLLGIGMAAVSTMGGAGPAGASGLTVKVTPSKGLTNGKAVTITGKGLPRSKHGLVNIWFASECNAAVTGKLSPADASHCAVSTAIPLKVSPSGTFSATLRVVAGAVGDGKCGVPGSLTCVIGVGTASGQGTVVKISFKK
jgi:hypothetical protein